MASDPDKPTRPQGPPHVEDEAVYKLPCRVPFKVFLRPDADAEQALIAACREAAGVHIDAERQPSRKGNFICLRLTLHASRHEQIRRVRAAIAADASVIMAL